MSALIIIESQDQEPKSLPSELSTFAQRSWKRGDLLRHGGTRKTSGHTLSVSQADLDAIDVQLEDVRAFLSVYASLWSEYVQILEGPKAELILTTCISPPGVAQEVTLPADLVAAAGSLCMAISIRTFLTDESAA